MSNTKRFIFFGTDSFVVPVLEALLTLPYECVGVVTAADRKGRGKKVIPSPVKVFGISHHLAVFTPEKLKDFYETFEKLTPDFCIIASYGKIIPQKFIDLPPFGILNIHPSLLPRHRGPSPVPATILAGDTKTGVAIMKIDAGVDTGELLDVQEFALTGTETTPQLLDSLFKIGATKLTSVLPQYLEGNLQPRSQATEGATHSTMFAKDQGKLDFNENVEILERKVRALNPWPGTFVTLNGQKLKVLRLEAQPGLKKDLLPGTITTENNTLEVAAKNGTVKITELQPEGKKPQKAEEFLRGHRVSGQQFI
jgi:methionyl-tRNA formyltransferase